jgi:putative restriction endonuclease
MFAIATTDLSWFEHVRSGHMGRTVNFWTPTPWGVKGLHTGDRLYFMLKAPIRKVAGFGSFTRYVDMTASEAWAAYGLGNGVDSLLGLVRKIESFAEKRSKGYVSTENPLIGCIELSDVVTLDDADFITPDQVGLSFPNQVVKLKYFSGVDPIAAHLGITEGLIARFVLIQGEPSRKPTLRKDRKHQSAFRQEILANYDHRCCITSERVVELLEAAHIQPYIDERSNHPQNGLCLRVDLHRLFDEGLISLTSRNTVAVSDHLAGTSYAGLEGAPVSPPVDVLMKPSPEALGFHRTSVFRSKIVVLAKPEGRAEWQPPALLPSASSPSPLGRG